MGQLILLKKYSYLKSSSWWIGIIKLVIKIKLLKSGVKEQKKSDNESEKQLEENYLNIDNIKSW